MHVYSEGQGSDLVKAARNSIELYIMNPAFSKSTVRDTLEQFETPQGVFVTLEHYPTRELRGSVGFPRAMGPLKESVIDAAIAAAFEDLRYVSVSKPELDDLLVEVSVLSNLTPITGGESKRLKEIKIGTDGLMVQYGLYSGLILPGVAVEQKWTKKQFLEETCIKAGLHANYWSQPNVKLFKFETQVFREEVPRGKVIEVKYDKE